MFRLILIASLIPIIAGLLARWWFGARVLFLDGNRTCRCDLTRWLPEPGDTAVIHRAEGSAAEFGRQLRVKALAEWNEQAPRAVQSREKSYRFGQAVPPLSGIIAIFAMVVGKVPVFGAITILLGATALATALGLLALPSELAAIARAARKITGENHFPNSDDRDAVIRCANAFAWTSSLPPILRFIHG